METVSGGTSEHSDKGEKQKAQLVEILSRFKRYFTPIFVIALKKAEGKALNENEQTALDNTPDSSDLILRIEGLIRQFGTYFNTALEAIDESYRIAVKTKVVKNVSVFAEEKAEPEKEAPATDTHRRRVPKGYSLWDLKQMKLHESTANKRIWISFWSLRGESGVGEFIYNPNKKLIYFKPYDPEKCSAFPVVIDNLRNASVKAKGLYYRVVDDPSKL